MLESELDFQRNCPLRPKYKQFRKGKSGEDSQLNSLSDMVLDFEYSIQTKQFLHRNQFGTLNIELIRYERGGF